MILYPAIDIRKGKVVRLFQGDPEQETIHADDSVAVAYRWVEQGAEWLHVVNLDGAFGEANTAIKTLASISALGVPVQFGGGLRSLDDVSTALEAGAARAVLGTLAVTQPQAAAEAVTRFGPEAIAVALDVKDGKVATHGWQQVSEVTPIELGRTFAGMGVRVALYTDISRDGALTGVNVEATAALAQKTGLEVIASGGVSTLEDLRRLRETKLIEGVVVGKALYEERFTLSEALEIMRLGS